MGWGFTKLNSLLELNFAKLRPVGWALGTRPESSAAKAGPAVAQLDKGVVGTCWAGAQVPVGSGSRSATGGTSAGVKPGSACVRPVPRLWEPGPWQGPLAKFPGALLGCRVLVPWRLRQQRHATLANGRCPTPWRFRPASRGTIRVELNSTPWRGRRVACTPAAAAFMPGTFPSAGPMLFEYRVRPRTGTARPPRARTEPDCADRSRMRTRSKSRHVKTNARRHAPRAAPRASCAQLSPDEMELPGSDTPQKTS
jgi:hypothetical protein